MNNGINLQKDNQSMPKKKNNIFLFILLILLGLAFIIGAITVGLSLYRYMIFPEKAWFDPPEKITEMTINDNFISYIYPDELKYNLYHCHLDNFDFEKYPDWCPFELKSLGQGDAGSFERIIVDSGLAGLAPPSEELDTKYTIVLTDLVVTKIDSSIGEIKLQPCSNPIFYINGNLFEATYVETPDSIKVGDKVEIMGIIRSDMQYSNCIVNLLEIKEVA